MVKQVQQPLKPLEVLRKTITKPIMVDVRGNRSYSGILDGYDVYMNLVLKNAAETINGENKGVFDTILVRGDNVIYVSPSSEVLQ
ncbi:MAG: LSM domain-containing protein [Thermoplasmata archaeon]